MLKAGGNPCSRQQPDVKSSGRKVTGASPRQKPRSEKVLAAQPQNQPPITAADFALVEGTWKNQMDDSPVPILDSPCPDIAGVLLLDAAHASEAEQNRLAAAAGNSLCLVIPEHECPTPCTCSSRTSVPVIQRPTGKQHLTAMNHNVAVDIVPYSCHDVQVEDLGATCCSFVIYRDEWGPDETWKSVADHPVRLLADAFKQRGVEQPFAHLSCGAQASKPPTSLPRPCKQAPSPCPVDGLTKVLQVSGFNRVYVTPRTWDLRPAAQWSIVDKVQAT